MQQASTDALWAALRLVAPGTPLREGLDRILQANMGALIVVGDDPDVLSICSGGFPLGVDFTPQRFSELAKMDGAIILSADTRRISRANVHLVPDPDIPTSETGTRHRTAERVARQLALPVVTISEEMSVVSVHVSGQKKTLERIPRVLARSDQALQILGRYRLRLDTVMGSLSALEVEDLVTVRDVADVLQRAEMVRRIATEVAGYVIELGIDGRLVQLQLEELTLGVDEDLRLVLRDYFVRAPDRGTAEVLGRLDSLDDDSLLDVRALASVLHLPHDTDLDSSLTPKGYRVLARIPRLSEELAERIVARFDSLAKLMRAGIGDLVEIDGIGEVRARMVKDGLSRLAEASILERYS
ncbi:MAG TPA: DNA integrity scanning diadenylate cyclase DisA [Acidimicrobiia bacterium]